MENLKFEKEFNMLNHEKHEGHKRGYRLWTKGYGLLVVCFLFLAPCLATVTETSTKVQYSCNGSSTAFAFSFPIVETSDIVVILRTVADGTELVLTEGVNYNVSATNNDYSQGGTVTATTAYSSLYQLTIMRDTPDTQEADLDDSGTLRLETLEDAMDRATMQIQQLTESYSRAIHYPRSDSTSLTGELDDSISRKGGYLGFSSSTGEALVVAGLTPSDVTVSPFAETALDDATGAAMLTTMGAMAVFNVKTYGAIGDGDTNDTAAITSAITAAAAADGGIVWFPTGVYLCNVTLSNDNIRLLGAGSESPVDWDGGDENCSMLKAYTTDPVITIYPSSGGGQVSGIQISNLTIDGNDTSKGIYYQADNPYILYFCRFENLNINNTTYGIDLYTYGGVSAVKNTMNQCVFDHITVWDFTVNGIMTSSVGSYNNWSRILVYDSGNTSTSYGIYHRGLNDNWNGVTTNTKVRIDGANTEMANLTVEGIYGTTGVATTATTPAITVAGYAQTFINVDLKSTDDGGGTANYGIAAYNGPNYFINVRYWGNVTELTYPFTINQNSKGYVYFYAFPSTGTKLDSTAHYNATLATYSNAFKNWTIAGDLTYVCDGLGQIPMPQSALPAHSANPTNAVDGLRGRIVFNDTGDDHFYGTVQKNGLRVWKRLDTDPADFISYENASVFYEEEIVTY